MPPDTSLNMHSLRRPVSENAVAVLRHAATQFGMQATILSDNGSYLVSRGGRKKPRGTWTLAL